MKPFTILVTAALSLSLNGQSEIYDLPEWAVYGNDFTGVSTTEISLNLNRDHLGNATTYGLGAALEKLPSVSMLRRGHNSLEPNVRGFTGGQIATLFNGLLLPEGSPTQTGSPINLFSLDTIASVKVETAVPSVVTGLSNIGARISIETYPGLAKNPKDSRSQGDVYAMGSDGDAGISTGINHQVSTPRYAYFLAANYRENEDYRAGDGRKVDADYSSHTLDFSNAWRISNSQTINGAIHWIRQDLVRNSSLPLDARDTEGLLTTMKYEYQGNHSIFSTTLGYGHYDHPMDSDDRTLPAALQRIHTDMKSTTIGSGVNYLRYFNEWVFKTGLNAQYLSREAERMVDKSNGTHSVDRKKHQSPCSAKFLG